eukprot:gene1905-2971_t
MGTGSRRLHSAPLRWIDAVLAKDPDGMKGKTVLVLPALPCPRVSLQPATRGLSFGLVLDLGAHTGFFANNFARDYPQASFATVDVSWLRYPCIPCHYLPCYYLCIHPSAQLTLPGLRTKTPSLVTPMQTCRFCPPSVAEQIKLTKSMGLPANNVIPCHGAMATNVSAVDSILEAAKLPKVDKAPVFDPHQWLANPNNRRFHYVLALSTTHWWGMQNRQDALRVHGLLFKYAPTVFLEMPCPKSPSNGVGGGRLQAAVLKAMFPPGKDTEIAFIKDAAARQP